MTPADMAALWEASDAHAVLAFRGQALTDAQQITFTEKFRPTERCTYSPTAARSSCGWGSRRWRTFNLDAATGQPQTGSQRHRMVNLGNRLWHTDSSFRLPRGGFSLLYAHAVPPPGPLGLASGTRFARNRL